MRCMELGGFIPGKAKKKGNSIENDTIDAKLSPGEIVIDRETLAKGPMSIMDFVMKELKDHHPDYKKNFYDGGVGSDFGGVSSAVKSGDSGKPSMTNTKPAPIDQAVDSAVKSVKSVFGFSEGGEVPRAMAHGGSVDNSINPDNSFNQYHPEMGILGGTVYHGSTDELFLFGDYCFDIDRAREMVGKQANTEIPVSQKWIDKIKIDPKEAMTSKSKNPVFIAQIHTPNGVKPLLIDGNHRMFKAIEEKKTSIPAYVFSPEQTSELFAPKPEGVDHPRFESIGTQYFKDGGTAKPDLFAPPTEDELGAVKEKSDLFAPPTDQELGMAPKEVPFKLANPGAGAMRQDILSKEEMAPVATNLKYPAAIVGGAIGGIPGAGLAGAAAEAIGQGYKATALHQDIDPSEAAKEVGKVGIEMAAQETGGRIIGEIPGLIGNGAKKVLGAVGEKLGFNPAFIPKPDVADIDAAGKALGIDVPNAVRTSNPTYQKMESGLAQSPTIPAKPIRENYEQYFQGLKDAAGKIEDLKSIQDPYSTGSNLKSLIDSHVAEKVAPTKELYKGIDSELVKIPVDKSVVQDVFKTLEEKPEFMNQQGQSMLNDWKGVVSKQKDLGSLKETRSGLYDELGADSKPIEQKRIDSIYKAMTDVRNNSINAQKMSLPPESHPLIDSLNDQLTLADRSHASNIEDLNGIKRLVGNKEIGSPSQFSNIASGMREGDLTNKAVGLDTGSMKALQKESPQIFEQVKQAKIDDMIGGSTRAIKGFNDADFFKRYNKLDGDMKDLLFDPKTKQNIEALQTLRQATPEKLGPSGTPEGQHYMADLSAQIKNTASDYLKKQSLEPIAGQIQAPVAEGVKKSPIIAKSAAWANSDSKNPTGQPSSGPQKWYADGINNLTNHADNPQDKKLIESMRSQLVGDPKGQQLLIEASTLKPGSKRLNRVLSDIKGMQK